MKARTGRPVVGDICPWVRCPDGHAMVVRRRGGGGPSPIFLGCSEYPKCTEALALDDAADRAKLRPGASAADHIRLGLWFVSLMDDAVYQAELQALSAVLYEHLPPKETKTRAVVPELIRLDDDTIK